MASRLGGHARESLQLGLLLDEDLLQLIPHAFGLGGPVEQRSLPALQPAGHLVEGLLLLIEAGLTTRHFHGPRLYLRLGLLADPDGFVFSVDQGLALRGNRVALCLGEDLPSTHLDGARSGL
jgi:hypothetical protein